MSKTTKLILDSIAETGAFSVYSDEARKMKAAEDLERAGKIRRDRTKTIRGMGLTTYLFVAADVKDKV